MKVISMKVFVKNMVCNRCIAAVRQEFEKIKLPIVNISLGEVELAEPVTVEQLSYLSSKLEYLGFELLDDQKQKQIEKIKNLLINKVQSSDIEEHFSISNFLGKEFKKDYSSISRLFSEVEGITIEQFFILQKVEKIKEFLTYGEMNLKEISYQLGYSSPAHLSAQFKKVIGLSPREFKNIGGKRKPLDKV